MIEVTIEMIEEARGLIANGTPEAVGYRLAIMPIEAETGMEVLQASEFEFLAAQDFQMKTGDQAERESIGTNFGILVDRGKFAYATELLGKEPWIEEGDVVITEKYCGVAVELPPGSGQDIRFANDESILGRMVKK